MRRLFGLGCDGEGDIAVDPLRPVALRCTGAGDRHPDVQRDGRGCSEVDDLPAVNRTALAKLPAPEARRLFVQDPTGHIDPVFSVRDLERSLGHSLVANGTRVHKGLVREVHQVVDRQ